MTVATYTKTGNKATTPAKLDKKVFGVAVENHELLKQAYVAYLTNGRNANPRVKTRGLVRGGGRKPWRQKGTGRARFGSIRNPIWRGGGIVFGPTGQENHTHKLSTTAKRTALIQALSLAAAEHRVKIIEAFDCKDGKVKPTVNLLTKLGADRNVLLVVDQKDNLAVRATRNLPYVTLIHAKYLNVYEVTNADHVVITKKALEQIEAWLGGSK